MIARVAIIIAWILIIFGFVFSERKEPIPDTGITVFTFAQMFDPAVIEAFEQKTGIKVHLSYYDSNEELYVKLKKTGGAGYDLIIPSDYTVALLREDGLLKKLDKSKLHFIDQILPSLRGHEYDPHNDYSLPFQWDIVGFGILPDVISPDVTRSYDALFKPQGFPIIMTRDPNDAVNLAAYYLYGPVKTLTPEQIIGVRNLLIQQRTFTHAYSSLRGDFYLATRSAPLTISLSSYVFMAQRDFPYMTFETPDDWTFISIENVAIPKASKKADYVYTFLNEMYKVENLAKGCDKLLFYPALDGVLEHMKNAPPGYMRVLEKSKEQKLYFFDTITKEETVRSLWVDVKTHSY